MERRWVACAVMVIMFAAGAGVGFGAGRRADQRLDDADVALQKAEGLLNSAQNDNPDPKSQHVFDRQVGRAIDAIEAARSHIVKAAAAADAGSE
jgi:hypothetical protein